MKPGNLLTYVALTLLGFEDIIPLFVGGDIGVTNALASSTFHPYNVFSGFHVKTGESGGILCRCSSDKNCCRLVYVNSLWNRTVPNSLAESPTPVVSVTQ